MINMGTHFYCEVLNFLASVASIYWWKAGGLSLELWGRKIELKMHIKMVIPTDQIVMDVLTKHSGCQHVR